MGARGVLYTQTVVGVDFLLLLFDLVFAFCVRFDLQNIIPAAFGPGRPWQMRKRTPQFPLALAGCKATLDIRYDRALLPLYFN